MGEKIIQPPFYNSGFYNTGAGGGGGSFDINNSPFYLYGGGFMAGKGLYIHDGIIDIQSSNQRAGIYPAINNLLYSETSKLEICVKCKINYYEFTRIIGFGCNESNVNLGRLFRVSYNRTEGVVQLDLPTSDGTAWQSGFTQIDVNMTNDFHSVGVILEKETNNVKFTFYVLNNDGTILETKNVNSGFELVTGNDEYIFGIGKEKRNELSFNFYYNSKIDLKNTFIKLNDSLIWGNEE